MSISFRQSIRWLPNDATEPTHTVVLTGGKKGVFLDVRFLKETNELDWAFAGYRYDTPPNNVTFEHHIDSRTLDARSVVDEGTNTPLPDGTTLERGAMLNPDTGIVTPYEEVWEDAHVDPERDAAVVFLRNKAGTVWRARVGDWELAMGRRGRDDEAFWAWQGKFNVKKGMWEMLYKTGNVGEEEGRPVPVELGEWVEGSDVQWNGDVWTVLERT
ncbi:hypothetical protein BU17DRAFT_54971 [Hysterangium stoloniferum]|nr:hypothetical protein BU17DRAFT_54971 [Hysterangium stoloniferum]